MVLERMLSELRPKGKGKIRRIEGEGKLKRRLLDMGVIPGNTVEIVKLAPLGDPVDVLIKGYHLSLRKDEAQHIVVETEDL
jgi:Fe2+ transport system protein FeoA